MILLTIILCVLAIAAIFAAIFLIAGGVASLVLYGDIIICIAIVVFLVTRIIKRLRK